MVNRVKSDKTSNKTSNKTNNKINRLFGTSVYDAATATNYAGAPTFVRSDEERLVQALTTGTFEPTFYADAQTLAQEAVALCRDFAERDPHFLAQAIVYARTEGLLRLAPIVALITLSASPNPEAKEMFRRIFPRVILTPGDLQDALALCRAKGGSSLRGMGKSVQHAAQRWLAQMSEYHAIKYGAQSQQMSLRDIYRLTRPRLAGQPNAIARWIVRGEVDAEATPQIAGYEAFKAAAAEQRTQATPEGERAALALVTAHRLPWEVVAGQMGEGASSRAAWTAMLYQMPYMALLRNLNNLIKHEVTADGEALAYIIRTLADPARVATSKQLPFRFLSASKALADGPGRGAIATALDVALEASFVNMPEVGARVLIANDISGSMTNKPSARSDMTMAEIAGIFAAAAYKKAEAGQIVSFDTQAYPRDALHKDMGLTEIAQSISGYGGGTSLSAPLMWAFGNPERVFDVAIFLTDSESWYDHLTSGRGAADLVREYRARVNPHLVCFFVQLVPYQHAVAPQSEPGMFYLYGWNASLLTFIGQMAGGGQSQVDVVRQVSVL